MKGKVSVMSDSIDEFEVTWEVIEQLTNDELQELLWDEEELDLSLEQVAVMRQLIQIAGNLDAAWELVQKMEGGREAA